MRRYALYRVPILVNNVTVKEIIIVFRSPLNTHSECRLPRLTAAVSFSCISGLRSQADDSLLGHPRSPSLQPAGDARQLKHICFKGVYEVFSWTVVRLRSKRRATVVARRLGPLRRLRPRSLVSSNPRSSAKRKRKRGRSSRRIISQQNSPAAFIQTVVGFKDASLASRRWPSQDVCLQRTETCTETSHATDPVLCCPSAVTIDPRVPKVYRKTLMCLCCCCCFALRSGVTNMNSTWAIISRTWLNKVHQMSYYAAYIFEIDWHPALGFLKADPPSNYLVGLNQASVLGMIARARPTSKGGSVDHRNHDFITAQSQIN